MSAPIKPESGDAIGEVLLRAARPLSDPRARYQGFHPHEEVLPAGTVMAEGARPLTCDILFQRDVAVKLRDGTTIYTDIYRPTGTAAVPAIVAWSPYGKNLGNQHLDDYPFRMGVPRGQVSELNKWEAPDPAVWCAKGYAILNPDARGAYTSEGNARCWSAAEGEDGADFIDWAGEQSWCTGKVGLAGNSWLTVAQWFIAAERPKHLAAIAPWEGICDVYRDVVCAGGIPDPGFMNWLIEVTAGHGMVEDVTAMLEKFPLMNAYWEQHIARIARIEVPAFVVSSWSSMLHTPGTFHAYQRLTSPKWLRVHGTQEWPDFYAPQTQEELARFFDHYLKGLDNGWEATPKVQLAILSAGPDRVTVERRPEGEFPLARTRFHKYYLDVASGALVDHQPQTAAAVRYPASGGGQVVFRHTFDKDEEWVGFAELVMFVEAEAADDMDIFVSVNKLGRDGEVFSCCCLPTDVAEVREHLSELNAMKNSLFNPVLFYEGPWGRLRASHREVDEAQSLVAQPFLAHRTVQPLSAGQIVQVRIPLTPTGMTFAAGETLQLIVGSDNTRPWPFPGLLPMRSINAGGNHVIHSGGAYESYLLVPETHGIAQS